MTTARSAASPESEAPDRPARHRPSGPEWVPARRPVIRPRPDRPVGAIAPHAERSSTGNPAAPVDAAPRVDAAPPSARSGARRPAAPPGPAAPPSVAKPEAATSEGVEPARRVAPPTPRPATGPRHRRALDRRRRLREELIVLLVFVIALAVTIFLLASQWLQNSAVTGTVGASLPAIQVPLPTASSNHAATH
jgi:hypothetical protein